MKKSTRQLLMGVAAIAGTMGVSAGVEAAFNDLLPDDARLVFDFFDRTSTFNGVSSPAGPDGSAQPTTQGASLGDRDQTIFGVNSLHVNANPPSNGTQGPGNGNPPSAGPIVGGLNLSSDTLGNQLSGVLWNTVLTQLEVDAGADGLINTGDDVINVGFAPDVVGATFGPGHVVPNAPLATSAALTRAADGGVAAGPSEWSDTGGGSAPQGSGGIIEVWLEETGVGTQYGSAFVEPTAPGPGGNNPLAPGDGGFDFGLSPSPSTPFLSDNLKYDADEVTPGTQDNLQDGTNWLTAVMTPLGQTDIDEFFDTLLVSHNITDIDSGPGGVTPTANGFIAKAGSGLPTVFIQRIDAANDRGDFLFYANAIGGSFFNQLEKGIYDDPGNVDGFGNPLVGRDILAVGQNNVAAFPGQGNPNEHQGWQLDSTDPVGFGTIPVNGVPEPITAGFGAMSLLGLAGYTTRRRKA